MCIGKQRNGDLREDAQWCGFIEYQSRAAIRISHSGHKSIIIPAYVNCNTWRREFEELHSLLLENAEENVTIVGDLNRRIGDQQVFTEESETAGRYATLSRKARDNKMYANRRKIMEMCECISLTIFNGRTQSDEN